MQKQYSIPYEVYIQAARNWDVYTAGKPCTDWPTFPLSFYDFVGSSHYQAMWYEVDKSVKSPKHSIEKYNMLASPHFRTLLKAYEAKYGPVVY